MLAAAVAMVRTRGHAATIGAELAFGATARADLLPDDLSPKPTEGIDRNCHQRSSEECSAIRGRESPGYEIELVLIHRHP